MGGAGVDGGEQSLVADVALELHSVGDADAGELVEGGAQVLRPVFHLFAVLHLRVEEHAFAAALLFIWCIRAWSCMVLPHSRALAAISSAVRRRNRGREESRP
jgi:hypothetical protein